MKTAQDLLRSLSPTVRDPVTQPYTSAEVRQIAADEMLTVQDRRTLLDYADQLDGKAPRRPWWVDKYAVDPLSLPENVHLTEAQNLLTPLEREWLKQADENNTAWRESQQEIEHLSRMLEVAKEKCDEHRVAAERFYSLYRTSEAAIAFGAANQAYGLALRAISLTTP